MSSEDTVTSPLKDKITRSGECSTIPNRKVVYLPSRLLSMGIPRQKTTSAIKRINLCEFSNDSDSKKIVPSLVGGWF